MSPARSSRSSRSSNRTSKAVQRPRTRKNRKRQSPEALHLGGLLLIWGLGMAAAGLGVAVVHTQFKGADLRIETSRLQSASQILRDENARLEARLGEMRGGEQLRQRAVSELGMVTPASGRVEQLEVDPFRVRDYRSAEREARARRVRERAVLESMERGAI